MKSSPIRFMASMVGSSWKRADIRGDAPMRSPAETNTEFSAPGPGGGDVGCQIVHAPDTAEGV